MLNISTIETSTIKSPEKQSYRIEAIKTDFKKVNGYKEDETLLKQVIADGWNAKRIPLGNIGIHGFIANRGYIGLLLAYSKHFLNHPDAILANRVENGFQMKLAEYIENLSFNTEWVYNYKRFDDDKKNITRICDLIFENGILVEKSYYI